MRVHIAASQTGHYPHYSWLSTGNVRLRNVLPGENFRQTRVDAPVNDTCPQSAPVQVYRAYNQRALQSDSNHRYTTVFAIYEEMLANGWQGEGVTMCAPA